MLVHASPAPLILPAPLERTRIPVAPTGAVIGTVTVMVAVVPPATLVPTCCHSEAS